MRQSDIRYMTIQHYQITRDKETTENSGHALHIFLCYAMKMYIT